MNGTRSLVAALAALVLLAGCMGNPTRGRIASPDHFNGVWEGPARIIVCPCDQESLTVHLRILPSGYVMGRIGGAALRRAYISRNEGWQGRFYSRQADYVLRGRLEGQLVEGMVLEEGSIAMPVFFEEGVLRGEVHAREANGIEPSESYLFSATDMRLVRISDR